MRKHGPPTDSCHQASLWRNLNASCPAACNRTRIARRRSMVRALQPSMSPCIKAHSTRRKDDQVTHRAPSPVLPVFSHLPTSTLAITSLSPQWFASSHSPPPLASLCLAPLVQLPAIGYGAGGLHTTPHLTSLTLCCCVSSLLSTAARRAQSSRHSRLALDFCPT